MRKDEIFFPPLKILLYLNNFQTLTRECLLELKKKLFEVFVC